MPQRNDRSRSTPTTSPKNNSWFRMQAGHQSDADIYIYDEIGFWGVTAKQFISDLNALGDITHINLHINSPGGDVFEGIAIFNALKTHGASITVYVDGVAASMASVIAMVGTPVIMPENTFMMIHKPFGFTGGDAEDMRTYADLLDKVEAVLLPAYAQKTGKTTDEIAAMLADETWMSGAECLAHGFADQVTPAVKAMACIQSKRTEEFKKMPESIRNMITPPRNSAPRVQDDEPAASRTPVQAAAPVVDENSIRAQVLAEQKARVLGFDLSSLSLNANGGIYQSADLSRYSGTVVNRPTFFAFAKGAGVMGEAGPEAILPLRRGADGKLGVVADIGGSGMAMFAPQYNIEINNDGTNGQIGPAALKVVYDLGKKAAADFMQQQARDGGRLSGAYR